MQVLTQQVSGNDSEGFKFIETGGFRAKKQSSVSRRPSSLSAWQSRQIFNFFALLAFPLTNQQHAHPSISVDVTQLPTELQEDLLSL